MKKLDDQELLLLLFSFKVAFAILCLGAALT